MQSYTAYKDSGIPMIGEVPEHWEIRQLGRIGRFSKGGGGTKDDDSDSGVPCIRYGDLYTQHRFFITRSRACVSDERAAAYTPLQYGDVLFAGSGETIDEIGKSAVNLIPGPACCGGDVILFRPSIDIDARFLGYATDCPPAAHQKACMGRGITVMHIYWSDLKYLTVAFPPLSEQTAIVRFLDHVDRRIRVYVRAKRQLITLLEEQKLRLVQQAVTGRIDVREGQPYSAYRDSDVVYLGVLPAHWAIAPLRRMAIDYCDGPFGSGLKSTHYTEDGIRVVRLQNIGRGEFIDSDAAYISSKHYSSLGDHSVLPEDILVAGLGDDNHPAGRACVAPESIVPAMVKADCFRFRPDRARVEPKFLALQLTVTAAAASAFLSTGATRQRTNLRNMSARAVSIPPMDEQVRIVEYVANETIAIDVVQKSTAQQIAFLREYRARLIADVVTGKLDVRGVAARLLDLDSVPADHTGHDSVDPIQASGVSGPPLAYLELERDTDGDRAIDGRQYAASREKQA